VWKDLSRATLWQKEKIGGYPAAKVLNSSPKKKFDLLEVMKF